MPRRYSLEWTPACHAGDSWVQIPYGALMFEELEGDYVIDPSTWTRGPWDEEPNRVEWRHKGVPCLMVRNDSGCWCGYAGVAPGHELYGKEDSDVNLDAHGGITFAGSCHGPICHKAEPGEPDHVWWFGFDTMHAHDIVPAWHGKLMPFAEVEAGIAYRDLDYVKQEVERLAEQLLLR